MEEEVLLQILSTLERKFEKYHVLQTDVSKYYSLDEMTCLIQETMCQYCIQENRQPEQAYEYGIY